MENRIGLQSLLRCLENCGIKINEEYKKEFKIFFTPLEGHYESKPARNSQRNSSQDRTSSQGLQNQSKEIKKEESNGESPSINYDFRRVITLLVLYSESSPEDKGSYLFDFFSFENSDHISKHDVEGLLEYIYWLIFEITATWLSTFKSLEKEKLIERENLSREKVDLF